ncbi:rCG46075, isoform CRA_b [Rattus norvegicus]|uniref:RCG46075, isoform CRA_b n=1 Tax=Rattus norvegicus TaxID=10116 RepID=A6ICY1_RAT|nr:rCG46075, isoform CRA_b [Rattus norvegicus]
MGETGALRDTSIVSSAIGLVLLTESAQRTQRTPVADPGAWCGKTSLMCAYMWLDWNLPSLL